MERVHLDRFIKELRACVHLHVLPYNLGDEGKTANLIFKVCNEFEEILNALSPVIDLESKPVLKGFEGWLDDEIRIAKDERDAAYDNSDSVDIYDKGCRYQTLLEVKNKIHVGLDETAQGECRKQI